VAKKKSEDSVQVVKLDTQGQLSVELGGTAYVLRPSQEAISACERETGLSLFDLATLAANSRMRLDQIGTVVAELMRAYGKAHPEDPNKTSYLGAKSEKVADLAYEAGAPRIMAALTVILAGAINGGYTASGEARTPGK
jgi:hypothetical protein